MTVALVASMFAMASVSASAWSGEITFEVPSADWASKNPVVYAHYWENKEGGAASAWQTAEEEMEYSEDKATAKKEIPDGGDWNLIIISGSSGWQTYDTTMNANCVGDTIYVTGEEVENPVDSKKTAIVAAWKTNTDCGPKKQVTSIGNVVGTALLADETNQSLYDAFVVKFAPGGDYDWELDGQNETGKDWETIKKEVAEKLELETESESSSSDDSSADGTSSTTSNASTASSRSASSTAATGATDTGQDTTLFVILGVVLVAAAALIVIAATRKKVTE